MDKDQSDPVTVCQLPPSGSEHSLAIIAVKRTSNSITINLMNLFMDSSILCTTDLLYINGGYGG
jgi:hypothetical protein